MTRRVLLAALLSIPLGGCYGLWDTNQSLIQFVSGAKLETAKATTYAEERDGPRRRKVTVRPKTEAELQEQDKKLQERQETAAKPAQPNAKGAKGAAKQPEPTLSADKKPADGTEVAAKPQFPEQKAPPAVPRPAVKIDASADASATKPMIPLPSPAKSIPQNATPAEKSWAAKTGKRDKKALQQQEKADTPAEAKPAEPAQTSGADVPKDS